MTKDDASRTIGKIVSVTAERLVVELPKGSDNFTVVGFDDIHYVATLGSYVTVAMQGEYVVLEVVGLREKDIVSQTAGSNELDKASSSKFLDVSPVGVMSSRDGGFRFGVSAFPPLYADVLYARAEDIDSIFSLVTHPEVEYKQDLWGTTHEGTVPYTLEIGTSVVFDGYPVKSRLDDLFGGHLAILGNTGGGKSCTVASIVQSLFGREEEFVARGATFLFFDINGEYRQTLDNIPTSIGSLYLRATGDRVGVPEPVPRRKDVERAGRFELPHWFMSIDEWALLLRASERTQIPVLRTALGLTSLWSEGYDDQLAGAMDGGKVDLNVLRNQILSRIIVTILQNDANNASKADRIFSILATFFTDEICNPKVKSSLYVEYGKFVDGPGLSTEAKYNGLLDMLTRYMGESVDLPKYINTPFPFEKLGDALDLALAYEESNGNRQIREYCAPMVTRLQSIIRNPDYKFLMPSIDLAEEIHGSTESYLEWLIGIDPDIFFNRKLRQICIIDLDQASDESIALAAAVIARLVFEYVRRVEPRNSMPVHLVLEEAHRYIPYGPSRLSSDATFVFERIAKEGRKYGLFLIVASQRPSELSETVLSQCSNYIVHRIQNPRDLSHLRQMTPFISETVLGRLASLPKQHALIFGTSVNVPTTFRVRDASPIPNSNDARIRDIWYQGEETDVGLEDYRGE